MIGRQIAAMAERTDAGSNWATDIRQHVCVLVIGWINQGDVVSHKATRAN
jgi:hypothetical protein